MGLLRFIIIRAMPSYYNQARKREITGRPIRRKYKPYDQYWMERHQWLASSLYFNAFGILATSLPQGIQWVKREMRKAQAKAFKRELKN